MSKHQTALKLASSNPTAAFDLLLGNTKEAAQVQLSPDVEGIIADLPTLARRLILVSKQDESKLMLALGNLVVNLAGVVGGFPELAKEAQLLTTAGLKIQRGRNKV